MSVIVNLDKDPHRVFMSEANKKGIKFNIVWQKEREYYLEPIDYENYYLAKTLQIRLDSMYSEIPIV